MYSTENSAQVAAWMEEGVGGEWIHVFTGELAWGVDETLAQLEKVLHLYRSGQYLQNSTAGSQAGEWPL